MAHNSSLRFKTEFVEVVAVVKMLYREPGNVLNSKNWVFHMDSFLLVVLDGEGGLDCHNNSFWRVTCYYRKTFKIDSRVYNRNISRSSATEVYHSKRIEKVLLCDNPP